MTTISHWRRFPGDARDWFDAEEIERGRAYNRPLERLKLVRQALGFAIVVAFIAGDVGPKIVDKLGPSAEAGLTS